MFATYRWLFAMIAGSVLAAGPSLALAQEKTADATVPAARSEQGWWAKRHEDKVTQAKKGDIGVVFLGDSITQGWEGAGKAVWERHYAPRKPLNIGFSGDRTQHVLWRLDHDEVNGIKPKIAVMMIGTNNLGSDSPEAIAEGIKAIVAKLKEKLPETKILMLAIFPRSEKPNETRERLQAVNAMVQPLADGKRVVYLDIGKHFLQEDGTISKEIMPDFLHLSSQGYRIWAEAIEPTLWEMMEAK